MLGGLRWLAIRTTRGSDVHGRRHRPSRWPEWGRIAAMPTGWFHVLFWSGLRGAVAFALGLSLPNRCPAAGLITEHRLRVVLFTLLVQGTTAARRDRLGGRRAEPARRRDGVPVLRPGGPQAWAPPPAGAGRRSRAGTSSARCRSRPTGSGTARRAPPAGRAPGSSTTWADTTFIPDVIVQACRSWTSATPGASRMCARTVVQVDALRGRLEQDVDGLAEQAPGARAGSAGRWPSRRRRRPGASRSRR